MSGAHRGAKVGPRVAMLVSQAVVHTHQKLAGTKHKLAMMIFRSMSDEISEEVDITIGPILRQFAEKYPDDKVMAPFLDFMAYNHGQWKAITGGAASASGLTTSIAQVVNNELFPLVGAYLAANPQLLPDIGSIAGMGAAGFITPGQYGYHMAQQGISPEWQQAMIELQSSFPSVPDALDMMRRGIIDNQTFTKYARANGVPQNIVDQWALMEELPLPPADAADAVLRGHISQGLGESYAQQSGIPADVFGVLVQNTGEPLGLEQLLEAFRRGFITEDQLLTGIKQSRVRDEWAQTAMDLRYSPMSIADAVNAVVQNQLDTQTATAIADQNGLEPGQVDILFRTAGEPLSRTELEDLYNRGEITQADVEQGLRESRLKDKYVPMAFSLHKKLLEPRMLSQAVQDGGMTHEAAVQEAMNYGYSAEQASVLVGSASLRKLQTRREKIVTSAETLYSDGAITRAQLVELATGMGFDATEAEFIAEAADYHRLARDQSNVITSIRSRYVSHKVTKSDASGLLDRIGVPATQRDYLLSLWDVEASANVRLLTPAQIIKAYGANLITADDVTARLVEQGYSQGDADLLMNGA
jgi:hypothetical protein